MYGSSGPQCKRANAVHTLILFNDALRESVEFTRAQCQSPNRSLEPKYIWHKRVKSVTLQSWLSPMVTTPKIQQQKYYITGLVFQSPSRQDAYTRNLTQNELTLRHSTLISRGYGGLADLQIGHSSREIFLRCINCACGRSKTTARDAASSSAQPLM